MMTRIWAETDIREKRITISNGEVVVCVEHTLESV